MSSCSETKWTAKVTQIMERKGAIKFAIVGGDMQEPGWPDRFIAHRWWHGFLEFKNPTTVSTTKQRLVIRALTERGVNAFFCRRVDEWHCQLEDHDHNVVGECDWRLLLEHLRDMRRG